MSKNNLKSWLSMSKNNLKPWLNMSKNNLGVSGECNSPNSEPDRLQSERRVRPLESEHTAIPLKFERRTK